MHENLEDFQPQGNLDFLDRTLKLKFKRRLRLEIELAQALRKNVASGTATDESALSRFLNDRYEDSFPIHKLPLLTQEIGPGFMAYLATQCGGTYHHGEAPRHLSTSPGRLTGLLARESGATVQQLVDREWTAEERQADIPHLRKLMQIVESLLEDAEKGVRP